MPRVIDATLKAALASGTFNAFFQLEVGSPIQYIQVVSFTLSPFGELKVKAVTNTELFDIDYVILRRGVTINGTQYYLDTSQLLVHTVTYDGNYLTVEADILAKMKISIAADVTYTTLLTNLASQFGKSIDRKNPSAGFWGNTFYPTGKSLTLNRVSQIRAILKQKFFMGLTDYGNNTIRFFFADNTFSDGTITVKQLVKPETTYNYGLVTSIGLLWRNDARTVFKPNIDFYPLYNIGYVKDNDYIPYSNGTLTTTINAGSRIKTLQVGVEPITLAPNLEYLTGDQVQLFSSTNNLSSIGTLLVEEYLDTNKEPAWGIKISLWDYVTSTEGGALPGTIERSAPYTPLNTSEFNAVLSYTDNNIQAAMETLDDHVHAGAGEVTQAELDAVAATIPTTEGIQDILGAMVSTNTETGIAVTYDDTNGKLDFDAQTAGDARYALIAKGVTNGDSHNHVGGDGAVLNHTDIIAAFWNSVTVPASTTYYGCPFKVGVDTIAHQFPWAEGGVLSKMSIRISTAQPASGSLVITLQVNGVDSALVVTIAAGSAGGTTYSDTTHTVTFSATDRFTWKVQNNATATSAALTAVSMLNTKQTT